MDFTKYGPFASAAAIACALIAVFSLSLLKMMGNIKSWTWLIDNAPSKFVTTGGRVITIAFIAASYLLINASNYIYFVGIAVLCGITGFILLLRFDLLRKLHIMEIPETGNNGQPLVDSNGKVITRKIAVGTEADMRPQAKKDLVAQRKIQPMSLQKFMSGYSTPPYDAAAIWDTKLLATVSNILTTLLMLVILFAVLVLFLASLTISVHNSAFTS